MKENIEVKDVQKTEYLDKNGLDMLWAKVKENTHNQVEAESNRATIQETRIIETKADKSELGNYAPNTALEALEKKISANTAAISNKQNAGNYVPYETFSSSIYNLGSVGIDLKGEDESTETYIAYGNISVTDNKRNSIYIRGNGISIQNAYKIQMYIDTAEGSIYAYGNDLSHPSLTINKNGIKLFDGDDNHVLTSNASTIDITEYAKKTELPTVPTKTSQLTNDSDFITSADVDLTPYATTEALAAVDQRVAANTTAIANINKSNGIPYNPSVTNYYEVNKPFYIKCDNDHTAYINPFSGIKVTNSDTSYVDIIPSLLKLSNGDKTFEINQYLGGIQALDGTSNDSAGFKLNYSGLRIGKKSDINANNNELIFISVPFNNVTSSFKVNPYNGITLQTGNSQIALSLNGVSLPNGDTNHVLTSAATTIDINNYVLKSVYDEKIAALEARIAALEAKYTEATA